MILPEEIENQQFEVSFRGYNTREVDEFLNKVRTELDEMLQEQESLKRKIAAAELLAKDAKDHEEEFIASMQADRDSADAILASAKSEGERIIREAKNAASGIMTEVRRRAGDISAESRRVSAGIIEDAKAKAADIIKSSKGEIEEKLFSANTEADNIIKAAKTHAAAIESDAKAKASDITKRASDAALRCEEYMKEIRSSADMLCRELDAELKNSAARITILGRRIAAMDISSRPADEDVNFEEDTVPAFAEVAPEVLRTSAPKKAEAPARPQKEEPVAASPAAESTAQKSGGYFTVEYQQAMSELFGEDVDIPENHALEDDDTYDYLDTIGVTRGSASKIDFADDDFDDFSVYPGEDDDDDEDGDGSDTVTSEYSGFSAGSGPDLLDVFSSDSLDRVYKTPSDEDIHNILNDDS